MPIDPFCPKREELIALGAGLVTDADALRIGEHLDQCETCCTAMETLHDVDAIAVALRRPVPAMSMPGGSSIAFPSFQKPSANDSAMSASARSVGTGAGISTERLIQILSDCGLMAASKSQAFLDALTLAERPPDGAGLANAFVQARILTAYQAQMVLAGKGKTLVLGSYVVLDKLGQGGMGVVFKAVHRRLSRVVALKVLSPRFSARPEFVQRFQREVHAAAKLSHQHIVKALDAELTGARRFLVMEYVAGTDLSTLVKQRGRLPLRSAIEAVLQAARGLEFAHAQGIVHRDVKPSNLLRDHTGTIKLLDLGLARMVSAESGISDLTTTGTVMGTVDYMAPEQAISTKDADARADVYSLGLTLWYLLTGRVAYEGGTAMSKLLAHRDDPIPSLMATRMNMPPDLDRVFQKMAAKRPEQRYASMSEVIADLERCLQEVPLSAEDSQFFACERDAGSMDDFDTAPTEFGSALQPADESTLAISDIQSEYDTQPRGEPLAQPATSNHAVAASSRTTTSWIRSRAMRWSLAAGGTVAAATVGFWFARDHLPIPKTEIGKAGIASSKLDDSVGENLSAKEKSLNVTPSPLSSATAITTASGQNPTPSIRLPEPLSPQPVEDVAKARRRLTELDRELEKNPESVGAFNERSLWHKRLGMWREAITDVERMADLQPDLSIIRMQVVYIGVLAGDLDAYRRTCRYLIDNFGHSENVDDLERVCKAPLFVAGEFDLLTLPIQRFEESIHLDIPDRGSMTWACVTRAYVACQAGQPEEALTWLAKREPPRAAFHLWTYSRFVRAQALHKLGRSDDARAAFDEAVSLMPADLAKQLDGKLEPETLLSSESVHGDWLILTILRRQTQLLLDGPG